MITTLSGFMKKAHGLELPDELSEKVWLHEDGAVHAAQDRSWEFRENGIYQIQQSSDLLLLIFLQDEGKHHIFKSYRASWLMSFTDNQLIGREVLRMTEDLKPCPHCGGKVLRLELLRDSLDCISPFMGRVLCQEGGCGVITSWRIGVSREALMEAAEAMGKSIIPVKAGKTVKRNVLSAEKERALEEKLARDFLITLWNERSEQAARAGKDERKRTGQRGAKTH